MFSDLSLICTDQLLRFVNRFCEGGRSVLAPLCSRCVFTLCPRLITKGGLGYPLRSSGVAASRHTRQSVFAQNEEERKRKKVPKRRKFPKESPSPKHLPTKTSQVNTDTHHFLTNTHTQTALLGPRLHLHHHRHRRPPSPKQIPRHHLQHVESRRPRLRISVRLPPPRLRLLLQRLLQGRPRAVEQKLFSTPV